MAKLALSQNNKVLAGVCGGIAEYFGVDSLLVRILFVVLLFGGSLGFWAYILLWILAPKSK